MFGISYAELFLILGATAALIGTKDLPKIARTTGRLAGRSIGYIQLARGQFDSVMQQSQANKVHKELQDTIAQLEAIRYEIRSISVMNPAPFTRRLDNIEPMQNNAESGGSVKPDVEGVPTVRTSKAINLVNTGSSDLHSQAVTYAKLAEAPSIRTSSSTSGNYGEEFKGHSGLLNVLPVSAERAGLLPSRPEEVKGSDIVLEAILEADVANNAKHFFSQPHNQLPKE